LTPTLLGTVILRLTDDEGVTHSFEFTNVNYLPDSLVNLLSLRRLAELYPDATGHPDQNGTGIRSGFDNHVLFWNREQFKKTFITASLGLPECLFNSGYSRLEAFSTILSRFYDDKICWALASKEKVDANLDDKDVDNILTIGDNEVALDMPVTLTNLVSFFKDMMLKYNDGQGTDCTSSNQMITFCGVGSHHQHGIAEHKIKDITRGGRTLLLHAKRMFPEYISSILWPFDVKCYKDRLNNLVHLADGRTPYETLASLDAAPINTSNFHTFGCPCYILDHWLQSGTGKIPKWEPRARMGIYVGRSPSHASNVALI